MEGTLTLTNTNFSNFNVSLPKFHSSHSLSLSNFLHYKFIPRRRRFRCISQAIRTREFDINPRRFDNDDSYDSQSIQRKRRKNGRKLKQRIWWFDKLDDDDDDDDDEDDDGEVEKYGIFEQVVENLWILKVFRSYGWFLPIILISFLIATGPKAFLMALSLPFGLSVVIFAVQKLWGWPEGSRTKPRNRRKRKSKFGRRKVDLMEEDDDLEERKQGKRYKKRDYRSWVARNNGSYYKSDPGNRVNVNSFGGWDELVGEEEPDRARRPSRDTGKLEEMMEKERLNRSMERRDMPLVLKLLIAVFPFLASWTNML